jgi:uncharacterized protein
MAPSECLVMAKPAGPDCNLRCSYCYYVGKDSPNPAELRRLSPELLQAYIRQRLEISPGPVTHFEWHGGEPTLLGLDYFRQIVSQQRAACPPGRSFTNGLQTNGLLLNDAWASFLRQENFSVGLSLDGPEACHDEYRRTVQGQGSQARVVKAFKRLQQAGVFCNVLCVLHSKNTTEPDLVYTFFRNLGVKYLQFLPYVPPATGLAGNSAAATPAAIGTFLCRVFDLWVRHDVGRMVVQAFDEALRPLYGVPHALCVHRETCGDVVVLEHDGSFYACDHFVDAEHLLGNLGERSLAELTRDPRLRQFGQNKRDTLPQVCRACDVLAFCQGGCPKDRRGISAAGEGGLNWLCPAYQRFFRHVRPVLQQLAAHMRAGKALRAFNGRQDYEISEIFNLENH